MSQGFALFGFAVACTLGAIAAFTVEMLMAGFGIRAEVAQRRRGVADDDVAETPEPQGEHSPDPSGSDGGTAA